MVYGGTLLLFLVYAYISKDLDNKTDIMKKGRRNKRFFCILVAAFLFICSACKSIFANSDLINYYDSYYDFATVSFGRLYDMWRSYELKDFGYHALAKIFHDLGMDASVWMGAIALIFAVLFSVFLFKYSSNCFLSLLVLLSLYFSFTLSGLRQTMAIAFLFIAYHFIIEKKLKWFIVFTLIASMFHITALIFIPAYWIAKMKIGWKHLIFILVSLAIAIFFPGVFRSLIGWLFEDGQYDSYANRQVKLSWMGYLIQGLILVFCVFFRKKTDEKQIDIFINCMVIGLCLQSFSSVIAETFRASYYYSICSTVAIPNVIAGQKSKDNRQILSIVVSVALIAYMIWNKTYFNFAYSWG